MATNKRRRVDDDENNATAGANAPPGAPTTPATTNSGGTPGLKGAKPGDSSGSEGTQAGANGAANKKRRMAWSAEAIALGYEVGTIKNSAYVLLAQSGVAGMTVAAIVDAATKQGYVGVRVPSRGFSLPSPRRARARVRRRRDAKRDARNREALLPPDERRQDETFFLRAAAAAPRGTDPSSSPSRLRSKPTDCTAGARARPPTTA